MSESICVTETIKQLNVIWQCMVSLRKVSTTTISPRTVYSYVLDELPPVFVVSHGKLCLRELKEERDIISILFAKCSVQGHLIKQISVDDIRWMIELL
jgi:hypothetical protein